MKMSRTFKTSKMVFEFTLPGKATRSIGISGWNKNIYWHIFRFDYPSCKKFHMRLYNIQAERVIFDRSGFPISLPRWLTSLKV